jgi:hypothetical protein
MGVDKFTILTQLTGVAKLGARCGGQLKIAWLLPVYCVGKYFGCCLRGVALAGI